MLLDNSAFLTWEGDIASRLIDSCDAFLLEKINQSVSKRPLFWSRDFSSAMDYTRSIETNRRDLAKIVGALDERKAFEAPQFLAHVGEGEGYQIHAVRWPVLRQMYGYGLLVIPDSAKKREAAIIIPDADQTPEEIMGLRGDLPGNMQQARVYAERGSYVLIPALINRTPWKDNISRREFIYRSAFTLGRHIIGYELQKIFAAVDWFEKSDAGSITVGGYGEGGLLALYAGAIDRRIDKTVVGGYFGPRERIYDEPAERNLFGLLEQFGDAEIASLIAPRKLVILSDLETPNFSLEVGGKGKPGRITNPSLVQLNTEIARTHDLIEGLNWRIILEPAEIPEQPRPQQLEPQNTDERLAQMLIEMDDHNQWLLRESPYVRNQFMAGLDFTTARSFDSTAEQYRNYFAEEIIGTFDDSLSQFNARSRRINVESEHVTAYEVVLDVFPGLFAYGILLLLLVPYLDSRVFSFRFVRRACLCKHLYGCRPLASYSRVGSFILH